MYHTQLGVNVKYLFLLPQSSAAKATPEQREKLSALKSDPELKLIFDDIEQNGPSKRVKHVDIKFHFVKEQVENGTVQLEYCSTGKMLADALTKPLTRERVIKLRETFGLKKLKMKEGDEVTGNKEEDEDPCDWPRGRLLEAEAANHTARQLDDDVESVEDIY